LAVHLSNEGVPESRADEGGSRDGDLVGIGDGFGDEEVVLVVTVLVKKREKR